MAAIKHVLYASRFTGGTGVNVKIIHERTKETCMTKWLCRFASSVTRSRTDSSALSLYDDIQQLRLRQAKNSVLIGHSVSTPDSLLEQCARYGSIVNIFSFDCVKHCTLVEYQHEDSLRRLLSNARQFPHTRHVPVEMRFLFYRNSNTRNVTTFSRFPVKKVRNYGLCNLTDTDLMNCSSLDSQVTLLYDKQSLSELDIRLRYFLCSEIEAVVKRLFPSATVRPFGSSVSGLGRYNCDLDLVADLDLGSETENVLHADFPGNSVGSGLFFMTKMMSDNERSFNRRALAAVGGLIDSTVPHMINVSQILSARVPIVGFRHQTTNIDCDLCIDNRSAVLMSELLYYLMMWDCRTKSGRGHQRVAPLIFAIRQWASCKKVTRTNPGPYISNFMLTMLIVHFLQTRHQPLLPSLKALKLASSGRSKQLSADISLPVPNAKFSISLNNSQPVGELLIQFFEFYAQFDFAANGLSIIEGSIVPKPDPLQPLYIENPFERELNVAKNVGDDHLKAFQLLCLESYTCLRDGSVPAPSTNWGLLTVLTVNDSDKTDDSDNNVNDVVTDDQTIAASASVPSTADGSKATGDSFTTHAPAVKLNIGTLLNESDSESEQKAIKHQ